ncbi:sensor histidine kinase [Parapedobacter defluvii]|uniref:tetratricopeptide repeat-containing sensor histidine kinase n=1 Tax=Parapedobacter defluvii TaxID=2045106 RepID=UPI00333E4E15
MNSIVSSHFSKLLVVAANLLLYLVPASHVNGQQGRYTAYGSYPVKTPDTLLATYQNAKRPQDRLRAAEQLVTFHQPYGASDSVIYYAKAMEAALSEITPPPPDRDHQLMHINHILAETFQKKGLYYEALGNYLNAIQLAEKTRERTAIDSLEFGLANVYSLRGQTANALDIYQTLVRTSNNPYLVHQIRKELGKIYLAQQKAGAAKNELDTAYHYFLKESRPKETLESQLYLGDIALVENREDEAFDRYNDVKDKAHKHQFIDLYVMAGQRIGDLLLHKKDYEGAQMMLGMTYTNAIQLEDLESQQKALRSLQSLYVQIRDYENAYAISTQYRMVSDEITALQNQREVNELEAKYQTAQKEKELLKQQQEVEKQKSAKVFLLVGFLAVLIPLIALMYVYYQKLQAQSALNQSMERLNKQRITTLMKENELELLKANMDGQEAERERIARELHDSIGGNLAAIKLQLSSSGSLHIVRQVDDTYQQVRDLAHHLIPPKFSKDDFTELIAQYLKNFDISGKTTVSFRAFQKDTLNAIPSDLKVEIYKIIQELMTNTAKHADASRVEVQIMVLDNELQLIFEDNGKGFSADETTPGIGLRNLRDRLQRCQGTLELNTTPGRGTVIDITLPIKTQQHVV